MRSYENNNGKRAKYARFCKQILAYAIKKTYIWCYEYRSKKFPHRFRIEQPGQ